MRKLNDFKLVNVRVSQDLFEYLKPVVAYVEGNGDMTNKLPSLFNGKTLITMCHHVENLHKALNKRYSDNTKPSMEKQMYSRLLEISELWSVMRNGGYEFAYIMVDIEQPVYKSPIERMGILK